jgi:hypothetical protein
MRPVCSGLARGYRATGQYSTPLLLSLGFGMPHVGCVRTHTRRATTPCTVLERKGRATVNKPTIALLSLAAIVLNGIAFIWVRSCRRHPALWVPQFALRPTCHGVCVLHQHRRRHRTRALHRWRPRRPRRLDRWAHQDRRDPADGTGSWRCCCCRRWVHYSMGLLAPRSVRSGATPNQGRRRALRRACLGARQRPPHPLRPLWVLRRCRRSRSAHPHLRWSPLSHCRGRGRSCRP